MKESNIVSILHAYNRLETEIFSSYLDYYGIKIKEDELKDLDIFCNNLMTLTEDFKIFDRYFIGYSIPQIGKEFDLLRFGENSVINIEIKREGESRKVLEQLDLNKYYLKFLEKETHLFSYESSTKSLFILDDNRKLHKVEISYLIEKLQSQSILAIENINALFKPSNYLVSPFNSTQRFIDGEYFLTGHQKEIKNSVLTELDKNCHSLIAIKGKAGTGKTLLTYDIVKESLKSKKVIIIHCGRLNDGQTYLEQNHRWEIISIRNFSSTDLSEYGIVVVDEAQRMKEWQVKYLIEEISSNSKNCIFSYDTAQTLKDTETRANIGVLIEQHLTIPSFELNTKIRTNKEVARFIKCLFNLDEVVHKLNYSKVELKYFHSYEHAKNCITELKNDDWKTINYTPDNHRDLAYQRNNIENEYENAHTVIGQEYEKVIAVIDDCFYYNERKLSTRSFRDKPFYEPTKMLYQIVSRTRTKLCVVVINNPIVLDRCLKILNKSFIT